MQCSIMKFYFKKFGEHVQTYHERTKDLPIRIAPLKTFNDREAASMDLRPPPAEYYGAHTRHRGSA